MANRGTGFDLTLNIEQVLDEVRALATAGLLEAAELVQADSDVAVPVDTGELVGTSAVVVDEENLEAAVYYETDHAVVVHEKTEIHHDQGSAKFLETSLHDNADRAAQTIADRIRAGVGD